MIQLIIALSVVVVIGGSPACFFLTSWSRLGVMGNNVTWSVLLMSSVLRNFLLVPVFAEEPAF